MTVVQTNREDRVLAKDTPQARFGDVTLRIIGEEKQADFGIKNQIIEFPNTTDRKLINQGARRPTFKLTLKVDSKRDLDKLIKYSRDGVTRTFVSSYHGKWECKLIQPSVSTMMSELGIYTFHCVLVAFPNRKNKTDQEEVIDTTQTKSIDPAQDTKERGQNAEDQCKLAASDLDTTEAGLLNNATKATLAKSNSLITRGSNTVENIRQARGVVQDTALGVINPTVNIAQMFVTGSQEAKGLIEEIVDSGNSLVTLPSYVSDTLSGIQRPSQYLDTLRDSLIYEKGTNFFRQFGINEKEADTLLNPGESVEELSLEPSFAPGVANSRNERGKNSLLLGHSVFLANRILTSSFLIANTPISGEESLEELRKTASSLYTTFSVSRYHPQSLLMNNEFRMNLLNSISNTMDYLDDVRITFRTRRKASLPQNVLTASHLNFVTPGAIDTEAANLLKFNPYQNPLSFTNG